jgi:hypothetical protein
VASLGPYPDPIELKARTRSRGGRASHPDDPWGSLRGRRDVTILVHGYNNDRDDADRKWMHMHAQLRTRLPPASLRPLALLYWAGDHRFKPLSAAMYFAKVQVAVEVGQGLADRLAKAGAVRRIRVCFVGHSLGCRVVLEAIRGLRGNPQVRLGDVLLMAAAVPAGLCATPRRYARHGDVHGERILFSTDDTVLAHWFPLGQRLARLRGDDDPGEAREAVGLNGGPCGRWLGNKLPTGLDHGEYWTSSDALDEITRLLGGIPPHKLPVVRRRRRHVREAAFDEHRIPAAKRNPHI